MCVCVFGDVLGWWMGGLREAWFHHCSLVNYTVVLPNCSAFMSDCDEWLPPALTYSFHHPSLTSSSPTGTTVCILQQSTLCLRRSGNTFSFTKWEWQRFQLDPLWLHVMSYIIWHNGHLLSSKQPPVSWAWWLVWILMLLVSIRPSILSPNTTMLWVPLSEQSSTCQGQHSISERTCSQLLLLVCI